MLLERFIYKLTIFHMQCYNIRDVPEFSKMLWHLVLIHTEWVNLVVTDHTVPCETELQIKGDSQEKAIVLDFELTVKVRGLLLTLSAHFNSTHIYRKCNARYCVLQYSRITPFSSEEEANVRTTHKLKNN